jgi:hypothetical protein
VTVSFSRTLLHGVGWFVGWLVGRSVILYSDDRTSSESCSKFYGWGKCEFDQIHAKPTDWGEFGNVQHVEWVSYDRSTSRDHAADNVVLTLGRLVSVSDEYLNLLSPGHGFVFTGWS